MLFHKLVHWSKVIDEIFFPLLLRLPTAPMAKTPNPKPPKLLSQFVPWSRPKTVRKPGKSRLSFCPVGGAISFASAWTARSCTRTRRSNSCSIRKTQFTSTSRKPWTKVIKTLKLMNILMTCFFLLSYSQSYRGFSLMGSV